MSLLTQRAEHSLEPAGPPRTTERRAPARFIPALPTFAATSLLPHPMSRVTGAAAPLPFPFGEPAWRTRRYYLARNAIAHGLARFQLPPGSVALMPAYHHGVEVEAVRSTGLAVRFYRIDRKIQVDLGDLARRIDGRVRVLYLTHFAGFAAPCAQARALAREKGLLLVEDCALALLSKDESGQPLGQSADLSVFCLYKSLPVPHGGLLVSSLPPERTTATPPLLATAFHFAELVLRHRELRRGQSAARLRAVLHRACSVVPVTARVPTGTQHLHPAELDLGCSSLVDLIVRNQPYQAIVSRRRRNYERLRERIGTAHVPTGPLRAGTCPLFLPLWVASRDRALTHLAAHGIEAVDLWRVAAPETLVEFPEVAELRRHVIELPCHQDLDDESIDFIGDIAREVVA